MKTITKTVLYLQMTALLLTAALAGPAAAKGKDETELKDMVGKVDAAWSTLNPDNVAVYYAKDANLAFFDMAPLKYSGWTAYDQGVRGMFSAFESLKLTVSNVLDGDLEEVPYGDRPEVLIGAAFGVGFLAALILKRLGRR